MTDSSVSERPTFEQAFAAEAPATDSLPVTPSTETTPPESASAPTTAAPVEEVSSDVTPASGEPPKERWPDILNNTRAKTRADVEAEFKQRFSWAEAVDPAEVAQLQRWSQAYRADPVRWMAETISELREAFPHLTPALHSEAARILAGAKNQPQAPSFEPDIPVYDEAGKLVAQTFSADKVLELITHAVTEAVGKEVHPLKQQAQASQQEREALQQRAKAEETAQAMYQRAQQWDGFTDHEAAIAEAFAQHPEWTLQDAYIAVVPAKLRAAEFAKTLESLQTKAAASSVNPGAAIAASAKRPASFHDPSLQW